MIATNPRFSRSFEARDICRYTRGNWQNDVAGPCCAWGWVYWVNRQLGNYHPLAMDFSGKVEDINGGDVIGWNDTTDPAIVAAELNRIARKVGLLA